MAVANADGVTRRIAEDLRMLGVRRGTPLLVHSSVRSLGIDARTIGLEAVVQGFLRALGETGTLLAVSGTWRDVTPDNPVFDVRNTPTNVGALPEFLRTRPGTLRSVSPTHSVCGIGPHAEELLRGHHLDDTPCGPNSPFRRLPELSGKILFLGCGLGPNTSMHAVEELVQAPYLFAPRKVRYTVLREDGNRVERECWRHGFEGWGQRYARLERLLHGDALVIGRVLDAPCYLIDAPTMWREAARAMRADPFYFVERESP